MKKVIFFVVIILIIVLLFFSSGSNMVDLSSYTKEEAVKWCETEKLDLTIKEQYSSLEKGSLVSQSIKENKKYNKNDKLILTYSLGKKLTFEDYSKHKVNELGRIPVMMYHGIANLKSEDTAYTGGNIDKDGYNRTAEAFRNDLQKYYDNGYRMVRLNDYVDGIIDVEIGYSPIVLTFDDGNENNIKVTGKDVDGNIIIDPNSAVGILEEFREKYPDYNVTATFFVNEGLFNQKEYNEDILKWLIANGYDIGNHTKGHVNFANINPEKTQSSVGYIYDLLEDVIPNKYVNIVALPFGSPYKTSHKNFKFILNGVYNKKEYNTKSTLRVGWEADYSPFSNDFDKTFIKRIRAWDNNGKDFDIDYSLKVIKDIRYISDGDVNTIVYPKELTTLNKKIINKEVIIY